MLYPTHCTAHLVGVTGERHPFWNETASFETSAGHAFRAGKQEEKDRGGGFARQLPEHERYEQPAWWATDLLPAPLRHDSGHEGSHTFLTHEFVDVLVKGRRPAVDVHVALACTAPGIVAPVGPPGRGADEDTELRYGLVAVRRMHH